MGGRGKRHSLAVRRRSFFPMSTLLTPEAVRDEALAGLPTEGPIPRLEIAVSHFVLSCVRGPRAAATRLAAQALRHEPLSGVAGELLGGCLRVAGLHALLL